MEDLLQGENAATAATAAAALAAGAAAGAAAFAAGRRLWGRLQRDEHICAQAAWHYF